MLLYEPAEVKHCLYLGIGVAHPEALGVFMFVGCLHDVLCRNRLLEFVVIGTSVRFFYVSGIYNLNACRVTV
ncbi:membrane protein [Candidatus Magnetobacterium bavaricum]|uniref:Membrane protein n=1 Tax=Candidatus Magnetobacterium bavaricum TaxID=29290 RepID=A0A0F3GL23_9BACT|nr:membrane protein [Candidatus Magnetobacterium bavaricum]